MNWAKFQSIANFIFLWGLALALIGGYGYQFFYHAEPCPLCLMQRFGMMGVGAALLLNLRFGIKIEHYGLAILSALIGRLVSLRQIGMHVCPAIPIHGDPILGLDLYIWAFIVFNSSIFLSAVLLILKGVFKTTPPPSWGLLEKASFALFAFLIFANMITALRDCGLWGCL